MECEKDPEIRLASNTSNERNAGGNLKISLAHVFAQLISRGLTLKHDLIQIRARAH